MSIRFDTGTDSGAISPTYNRTQFQIGGAPIILNPNQPNAGYLQF